jgi:LacI family transcriptional regulator
MEKATIRDIAKQAGVCIATVSRVINHKENVLPETRRRILALIERTGYRPNAMGRGLVSRRSHNILLEHFNIADPYCVALAESISSHCQAIGYRMLLADCRLDPALEAEHLSRVRDGSVDGLIISPLPVRDNVPQYRELVRSGFPLVVMDNIVPGVRTNCVKYDDRMAGRMAMDYLFEKGHRRIALIQWQPRFHTVQDRRRSYFESHRKRRLSVDPAYLVTMPDAFRDWDRGAFKRLMALPKPPTAILTENEFVGVASMNMLLQCGVRIPNDVAVVAIGDALLDLLAPIPLTTISLHPEQAAAVAVKRLAELIENPSLRHQPPRKFVQTPSLIVRGSA